MKKVQIETITGIDTLEVTSPTFTEKQYSFFTHDLQRLVQRDGAEPKYKYRVNPDRLIGYDTSTLNGYFIALNEIYAQSNIESPTKTRIDFRFDNYTIDYEDIYKINKLLILLVAEHFNITNRYVSCDPLTAELKTIRINNKYLEMEFYNKQLESPNEFIKTRLELRSKALYDNNENCKEWRELTKWIDRLETVTDKKTGTIDKLTAKINKNLIQRYAEQTEKGIIHTPNDFITKYSDFIFTRKQLISLYSLMGIKTAEQQASKYKRKYKIEFFSLKEIQNYVKAIKKAAETFING